MALENFGILFAVVAAVGWGLYLVPMKFARGVRTLNYQAIIAVAIFLSTVAANLVFGFSFEVTYLGILSGLMWGVGIFLFTKSVDLAGLSIASPIMVGCVMLMSFLLGVYAFGDKIVSMTYAVTGLALLMLGVFVVSRAHPSNRAKSVTSGMLLTVAAGVIFGSYIAPLELAGVQLQDSLFSMSIGILASTWAIFFAMRGRIDFRFWKSAMLSGLSWNVANVGSLFAVATIGLAVAFPITQVGSILPIAIGAIYFKEIRGRKNLVKIFFAAALLIVGASILAASRN